MNNIEPVYSDYKDLLAGYPKEKIEQRYASLMAIAEKFIESVSRGCEDVYLNKTILLYTVLDYFSDIARIKEFHDIERANTVKIVSYEVYWIIKRKPFQSRSLKKEFAYVNEQFALYLILKYLAKNTSGAEGKNLTRIPAFFPESLFYYLKYRSFDAKSIEMMLLAFKAGEECAARERD